MNAYEVIQNLAIGVVSGIFSGVIVSMVFYILGNYQNEIEDAKRILMPLYEVVVLEKAVQKYGIKNSKECIQIISINLLLIILSVKPFLKSRSY